MPIDISQPSRSKTITEHEKKMWESFTKKIKVDLRRDAIVRGSVDLAGFEVDCILITNDCLCVIDFKAYGGEIELRDETGYRLEQFSTNALWYLKSSSTEVKGGSQGNPFDQIAKSKWELKNRIEVPNGKVQLINLLDFTTPSGVVLFKGDTSFPYDIIIPEMEKRKDGLPKWFHVTNMDGVIECIKTIEKKARLGLTYEEMQAISKQIIHGNDDAWEKCTRKPPRTPKKSRTGKVPPKTPKKSSTSKIPPQTSKSSAQPRAGVSKSPTVWDPKTLAVGYLFFSIFWWHVTIGNILMALDTFGFLGELGRFIHDNSLDYGSHLLWNGSINTWSFMWFVVLIISIPTFLIVPALLYMYFVILILVTILVLCAYAIAHVVVYFIENPY